MHGELLARLSNLYGKAGRDFSEGSVIFLEGTAGSEMYIIVEGNVQIAKTYKDVEVDKQTRLMMGTDVQILATLGAGDFFGEMALLNTEERSATAIALTDVKLIVLGQENLYQILGQTNQIVLQMLKSLSNRLREATRYPRLVPKPRSAAARRRAEASFSKYKRAMGKTVVKKEASASAPAPAAKLCEHCKKTLPQDAKFCLSCGAEVTRAE